MLSFVDLWLNRITMYRLMLYFLIVLILFAFILAFVNVLPYNPTDILFTASFLVVVAHALNKVFAKVFGAVTNLESASITALILALIVGPFDFRSNLVFLTLLAGVAMLSKYIVAWKKKHIFNPAGFAVFVAAVFLKQGASWWVGNIFMLPAVAIGGLLVLQKLQRFGLVASFFLVYLVFLLLRGLSLETNLISVLTNSLLYSPLLFFATVMLIEPATSPITRKAQLLYGSLVAISFILYQSIPQNIPPTLEAALLTGNIFAFFVNPKIRLSLRLKRKGEIAKDIFAFWFEPMGKLNFTAGQFLEWTLPHKNPDSRGVRRFFTIASSPTEESILLATKMPQDRPSSFKGALKDIKNGDTIYTSSLAGEFILPKDRSKKMVFIAGGIGITPFRSIIQYLLNKKESRDMVLFYSSGKQSEIAFKEIFDKAEKQAGLKTVYVLTKDNPKNWDGETRYIDEAMIKKYVADWKDRVFYASGPEGMVQNFEKMLAKMGIKKKNIKRDYFPGYELES